MVINDKYRFIFVHVPKAGGTRVTHALRSLHGNNAHWVSTTTKHEPLWTVLMKWRTRRRGRDCLLRRSPHTYFTFGFVRNPWARILSLYQYMRREHPIPEIASVHSFTEFIHRAAEEESWILELHSFRPQIDFFRRDPNGSPDVDFIGRCECLEQDFSAVTGMLGVPAPTLPGNPGDPDSDLAYQDHYTDETAAVISDLFAEDIRTFGYGFDRRHPEFTCTGNGWYKRDHSNP